MLIPSCTCPGDNYTCDGVVKSVVYIAWRAPTFYGDHVLEYTLIHDGDEVYVEEGGLQVTFRRSPGAKFSSSLHVRDLGLNGTNLTCEAVYLTDMANSVFTTNDTTICVVGN